MSGEYRIEFSVQRCEEGEDDFTEIGFGSSGACADLDGATYAIESSVSHGEWETTAGMPDPADVMAYLAGADQ